MSAAGESLPKKLAPWVGALLTFSIVAITAIVTVGSELRELRLKAEGNAAAGVTILAEIKARPTNDAMRAYMLESLRPLDSGIVQLSAEVRALSDRVRRLEEGK